MKFLLIHLIICSTLLVTLTKAEYKWDNVAQTWVLVEEAAPVDENYDVYGSGDFNDDDDDEDSDYYGSGDTPDMRIPYVEDNYAKPPQQPESPINYNNNEYDNTRKTSYNNDVNNYVDPGTKNNAGPADEIEFVDGPAVQTNDEDFYSNKDPNYNNNGQKTTNHQSTTSFFAKSGTMAAVIGGAVVGLLCACLCVMFVVYRMRKKDEGSYALDEPKRSPTANSYSKPPNREFYA